MKTTSKLLFLFFSILISINTFSQQIGPPSLSMGTNEVLFNKGVLDAELIGEIIAEKQSEIKKEMAQRLILETKLSAGPALTYSYSKNLLNTLLEHQDKNVIKKNLLEYSTELAVVMGMSEGYIRIKKGTLWRLERTYWEYRLSKFDTSSKDYKSYKKIPEEYDSLINSTETSEGDKNLIPLSRYLRGQLNSRGEKVEKNQNLYQDFKLETESPIVGENQKGKYIEKFVRLYEMKNLGSIQLNNSIHNETFLQYIILDLMYETCRSNKSLQRLGFFQQEFDAVAFQKLSHYQSFLNSNENTKAYKNLKDELMHIRNQADYIITLNLEYADLILKGIKIEKKSLSTEEITSRVDDLIKISGDLYKSVIELKFDKSQLNETDQSILNRLNFIAFKATQTKDNWEDLATLNDFAIEIQNLIPKIIYLNQTHKNEEMKTLEYLRVMLDTLETFQAQRFLQAFCQIPSKKDFNSGNYGESIKLCDSVELAKAFEKANKAKTYLAQILDVLVNLDKAKSYDQISKMIIDAGQIFPKIQDSRIMNELVNLQKYLIINEDSNRVDVQVEDLITYFYNEYAEKLEGRFGLYFTVGYNYFDDPNSSRNLSYVAEKVGAKYNVWNLQKYRKYNSRHYVQKQEPIVKTIYLLAYGSGLLYQIDALNSDDDFNSVSYGGGVGIRFYNNLDLNFNVTSVRLDNKDLALLGMGIDIPITEYLSRLAKKNKSAK